MAINYLSFSISSITSPIYAGAGEIIFYKQDNFPRLRADQPGIERSAYNTPVKYGGWLPEPHIWTLKVLAPIAVQPVVRSLSMMRLKFTRIFRLNRFPTLISKVNGSKLF